MMPQFHEIPGAMLTLGQGRFLAEGGFMDWWVKFNFRGHGASEFARYSDSLFFWIYLISAFFFVLLMGMMVVFTLKYRKKAGKVPERSAGHNTFLELSWSVIPTMLLTWMFFKGYWGFADAIVSPSEGLQIAVTAKQWAWNATYPNGAVSSESTRTRDLSKPENKNGVQDSPIFYIPENMPVNFRLTSEDVIHSFWVLDMRAKFDVFPNRYTGVWFKPEVIPADAPTLVDAKGAKVLGADGKPVRHTDHWVFCAEYCGSNHSEMLAVIRVVPNDYYQKWVKDAAEPKGTLAEQGAQYYKIKGCNSCHSIDGTKAVGPSWKNMYGYEVKFKDGSGMTAAEMTGISFANYVRKSLEEPAAQIVDGYPNQMQNFRGRITQHEIDCIIAYMSSPKMTDKPASQAPEDPAGAQGATGPQTPPTTPGAK